MSRYSVVVDDDIDPSNLQEVMWAVATRTDPAIDIDIIQRGMGSKNDPMSSPIRTTRRSARRRSSMRAGRAIICDEFPAVAEASKELQEKMRAKWKDLL